MCGLKDMPERQEAMESAVNKSLLKLQGAITASGALCQPLKTPCLFSLQKEYCFSIVGLTNQCQRLIMVH